MSARFPRSLRSMLTTLSIGIAVTVFVIVLSHDVLFEFPPFGRAELALIDARFQQRGPIRTARDSSSIVIVEISQESFAMLPDEWPWPKRYYARLVRNLHRAGARVIGLDVIFPSLNRSNPSDDADFWKAIQETNTLVLAGKVEPLTSSYTLTDAAEHYGNVFIQPASNQRFGVVNTPVDVDGVLRRCMPFVLDPGSGRRMPTFSMAVLNAYRGRAPMATVDVLRDGFAFDTTFVPRYDERSFLINYYGPSGSFRRIKFGDIIDDAEFQTLDELNLHEPINTFDDPDYGYLYDGTFNNKIVLVGSTMPEDKDLFPVPIGVGRYAGDNQLYGVEIHANVIQSFLDGRFIRRQGIGSTVLVVFVLSVFTFAFVAGLKEIKTRWSMLIELLGAAIMLAELVIVYWIALRLFESNGYLMSMVPPMLAVVVSYVASTVYHYVAERRLKTLIKSMFSTYVNPEVVNELLADPDKLRLGGERREMTVFFSDIENFTQIAEKLPPEALVGLLNDYLSEMTEIIIANEGTLDKYEGDAIVAFWGAPIPQSDHALHACRAAVAMQLRLRTLRDRWTLAGHPRLNVRIGINSGEMVVGNMGGGGRFDYTVIGDSVNLGARLEGANKMYQTNVIISESTYRYVASQVVARELDMLVVAGRSEPIRVYELMGLLERNPSPESLRFTEHYSLGLQLYRNREWAAAIQQFQLALTAKPNDYPSQLYIERSNLYLVSPPSEDWNGVFVLRTK
jgi:adenylate cyclase